jgi:hypothetical protein
MGYLHVDLSVRQYAKGTGSVPGDVVRHRRTTEDTVVILADGIGSGIRANVAANLCASRLLGLLDAGVSPREAFGTLVRSMQQIRDISEPYAVFTLVRVRASGEATVLAYEMPPTFLIGPQLATPLVERTFAVDQAVVTEGLARMEPGESLLTVSDGVTAAGLGHGMPLGWQARGLEQFLSRRIAQGDRGERLLDSTAKEARRLWGETLRDDVSLALSTCRGGHSVTVLTGPPASRQTDERVVKRFLEAPGLKIVCGGTTANLVARVVGGRVKVMPDASNIAPPRYDVAGLDLVTEGALTLNQAYHIISAGLPSDHDDGPAALCRELTRADRVHFMVGRAASPVRDDQAFRQQGFLSRDLIVPLLRDQLTERGKLVTLEWCN